MLSPQGNNAIGTYKGTELKVEDCTIEAEYLAFFASNNGGNSKITIDGGNYHTTLSNLLGVYGGEIVVEDGTFNGIAFANLTEDIIRGMCNLSDCAKGVDVTKDADGAWTIVVK